MLSQILYAICDKEVWARCAQTKWLFCIFLAHYVVHQSRAELECVLKDSRLAEAHVLAPAIVELFEDFFLLIGEALFKVLVMP